MSPANREASTYQRNALAPSLLAAAALFVAPAVIDGPAFGIVLFITSILAVIVAWFAFQSRQWWWIPAFAAVAVLWNPIFPLPFTGTLWTAAQPVAAVLFLMAGALIKVVRR